MTMFRHLLVPLDGSRLAETALPAAASLAGPLRARVTLLHVLERAAPAIVHGEPHLRAADEAQSYLNAVAKWLTARGVRVHSAVYTGERGVAEGIADRAESLGADLIVLCTHGRTGIRGFLFGRVAQQVLATGTTPVMIIRPSTGRDQRFVWRHILVPLDGSETAETALRPAEALARALHAGVLLMWVVPTPTTVVRERALSAALMPTAAGALLDAEAAEAATYLERVRSGMQAEGLSVAAMVERGEPVRILCAAVVRRAIDVVVMATHGRAGASALWEGSAAARMVAQGVCPVLLVRITPR